MIGKCSFILLLLLCAVVANHVAVGDNSTTHGMDNGFLNFGLITEIISSRCIKLLVRMKKCLKFKGLDSMIETVLDLLSPNLFRVRSELSDEMKCGLYSCILPMKKVCKEMFKTTLQLVGNFTIKFCSATTQLPPCTGTKIPLGVKKCNVAKINVLDCAVRTGLLEVTDYQITGLFRSRNTPTEQKKCQLYNCLLPLKKLCYKTFKEYSELLGNFNVRKCLVFRQQQEQEDPPPPQHQQKPQQQQLVSSGRMVFSVLISYLLLIGQFCVILMCNYF